MISRQDFLDFTEGFLTVVFGAGAVGGIAFGTTFPGWWVFSQVVVLALGTGTLAGIRKVNAGRRDGGA